LRDGSQAARLPRPDHCHAVARQADIVDKAEVDDVDADLWVDDVAEEVSQHLRARFHFIRKIRSSRPWSTSPVLFIVQF
jgi:hypothetical protein